MQQFLNGLAGFVIGTALVWIPVSMTHLYKLKQEVQQLKTDKISGWGND